MPYTGAITLDDCRQPGRSMLEIGCAKCPRYGGYRLDKLIAVHVPKLRPTGPS